MTEQAKTFAQIQSEETENYRTNMARLYGWTNGTLKGMKHSLEYAQKNPKNAQYAINNAMEDLQKLLSVMDMVWENRSDRVISFEEFNNA